MVKSIDHFLTTKKLCLTACDRNLFPFLVNNVVDGQASFIIILFSPFLPEIKFITVNIEFINVYKVTLFQ